MAISRRATMNPALSISREALSSTVNLNWSTVDPQKITEDVKRAWYEGDKPLHPSVGETKPSDG